jgi:pimeloyl-ACP methyl ester carboxylesterase
LNKLVLPWGELAYFLYGTGKKQFLMVHNTGGNHFFLAPLIEILQGLGEVIAPDLRGHGESDKPKEPYSVEELGEDLLELAKVVGKQKLILIGLNYGATLCEWMARKKPELFSHLILLEPPLYMEKDVQEAIWAHAQELHKMDPKVCAARLVDSVVKGELDLEPLKAALEKTPQEIQAKIYQQLIAYDRERVIEEKLEIPTLLMRVEESFSKKGVWQELYSPFEEITVRGSGPWLSLEKPHFISKEIKRFIKEHS